MVIKARPRFPEALVRGALAATGVPLTPALVGAIARYGELLLRWNARVNLTAVTDPTEILNRHFAESFLGARFVTGGPGLLVDVGSGAGFPGLALKLLYPQLNVLLLEPVKKKAAFLAEAIRVLKLPAVSVDGRRIEEIEPGEAQADWIITRALGGYDYLLQWSDPALKPGGSIVLWLGEEESNQLSRKGSFDWLPAFSVPGSRARVILCGRKRST